MILDDEITSVTMNHVTVLFPIHVYITFVQHSPDASDIVADRNQK